jgi:alkaline phosphatase D
MKIAFTSCCDPWNDPIQFAWTHLAAQNPEVLVLLGDNMYMDYGLGSNPLRNSEPRKLPIDEFSNHMHKNYKLQWSVQNFNEAITQVPTTYAIWDDHDFAWNNARGIGTDFSKKFVPTNHRILSRSLFQQYRDQLATKTDLNSYPANPYPTGYGATDLGGISNSVTLFDSVRLHLLDGRSFRPSFDLEQSFLGDIQRTALEMEFNTYPDAIHILASGTTLLNDWNYYSDFEWLQQQSTDRKIIVLSGDIHEPKIKKHFRVFEFTASAMAQPASITGIVGKQSNVFGMLEINQNDIKVDIFQLNHKTNELTIKKSASIDINNWELLKIRDN